MLSFSVGKKIVLEQISQYPPQFIRLVGQEQHQKINRWFAFTQHPIIYWHILVFFIIKERQLNWSRKTTWTTARNLLYESALVEELCPRYQKFLNASHTNGDELIIARHFRSLLNIQQVSNNRTNIDPCFILFDTFLLSVSPAIGVIVGMMILILFDGLLTQVVYHVDAMFNAFHRDALDFLLPCCPRYSASSWWKSQAILSYRSLCLYGHVIQFNAIQISAQKHRVYPRDSDPWKIDQDMNLVPLAVASLQTYMKIEHIVSALVLRHYSGMAIEINQ
ncbi:unnamed protein product [Rotaria socialis]|uniref:Uncharacterized protein n=1 Tax=Rotaria socialis TaxID=392032 RepID=A0A820TY58_9BILA|nr:unnamed protein product [Rotaria socialis]CAF4478268.1 unnamed protein product [Rotaria socialis]